MESPECVNTGALSAERTALPYLGIRYQINYHACNLDCPYCIISWRKRTNLFDAESFRAITSHIEKLPYRVSLRIGVGGEIFTSPALMDGIRRLCTRPSNIANVGFSTNLAADWEDVMQPFFASLDTSRLGIGCTLHDTVIDDIDDFFRKAELLRKTGSAMYIGFVALPGSFERIAAYKKRCADLGIPLILNALVGRVRGNGNFFKRLEKYPEAYTPDELLQLKDLWDTPHSYKLLAESCSTRGMACSAGRNYIYIDHAGNVFPCGNIRSSLGNILAQQIELQPDDTECPNDVCWCGNENQALRIVDNHYVRTPTLRMFYPKPGIPVEKLYSGYNPPVYDRSRRALFNARTASSLLKKLTAWLFK